MAKLNPGQWQKYVSGRNIGNCLASIVSVLWHFAGDLGHEATVWEGWGGGVSKAGLFSGWQSIVSVGVQVSSPLPGLARRGRCKVGRVEFGEKKVNSFLSFTPYNAFFKKQNKAKIRYIMMKLRHLTIIKLLVPIMLSGGWKICQTSYSMFSLSLLWHLRRK